jgi:LysR family transcriptional regulator, cell division regulator
MTPLQKEYNYFLIMCETLNISRAAEQLEMQQGGLSKALKKLEESLNGKLFIRSGRGLVLTELGRLIQNQIMEVQDFWSIGLNQQRETQDEISGFFKIGAHPTVAIDHLSGFLPTLIEKYQKIDLELVFKTSSQLTRDILSFKLDFGFIINPILHPDLIIKKIQTEYVSCWTKNPDSHDKILYYNPDMVEVSKLVNMFKDYKYVAVKDYDVLASFAANSNGICVLPFPVASRYGSLTQYGPKIMEVDLCLVYHVDRPKTLAFKTLALDFNRGKK